MDIKPIYGALRDYNYTHDEKVEIIMTAIFKICNKYNLKKIGLCDRDKTFKDSAGWPFYNEGNLFIDGKYGGWPIAWHIANEIDKEIKRYMPDYVFNTGAGNPGQKSINDYYVNAGIYIKVKNKWFKN